MEAKYAEILTVISMLIIVLFFNFADVLTPFNFGTSWSLSFLIGFICSVFFYVRIFGLESLFCNIDLIEKQVFRKVQKYYLVGVLKVMSDAIPGLLLILLSTPFNVGMYELCRKASKPLNTLIGSINQILFPSILGSAKSRIIEPKNLKRYFLSVMAMAMLNLSVSIMLKLNIKNLIFLEKYSDFIVPITLLLMACYLNLATLPFYPLSITHNRLNKRNLINATRLIIIIGLGYFLHLFGLLNFVSACSLVLVGSISTRLLYDFSFYKYLKAH